MLWCYTLRWPRVIRKNQKPSHTTDPWFIKSEFGTPNCPVRDLCPKVNRLSSQGWTLGIGPKSSSSHLSHLSESWCFPLGFLVVPFVLTSFLLEERGGGPGPPLALKFFLQSLSRCTVQNQNRATTHPICHTVRFCFISEMSYDFGLIICNRIEVSIGRNSFL